jgi:hypothetical protein
MPKFKVILALIFILVLAPNTVLAVPQERWAYEKSIGTPEIYSPFFGTNKDLGVGSSWNESRGSGPHKGVDQGADSGTAVGPMWSPARILRNQTLSDGNKVQTMRYYYSTTGKIFYSMYFHLSKFNDVNWPENSTPSLSDVTAYTGDTGSAGSPHLHFEVLDYVKVSECSTCTTKFTIDYGSRVGANPMSHVTPAKTGISTSTWKKFSVFKNPSTSGHRLYIEAWDSNLNQVDDLAEIKIYYKVDGGSTYIAGSMSPYNSSRTVWYKDFDPSAKYVDYFVIGRRTSTEKWVAFPVKRYDLGSNSTGVDPNNCSCTYETRRITF